MSKKVTLLFGVHAHQPVGNFPSVVDDALLRCYRPFLRVLYRHPKFLFSLHFSGWLFDYLATHYPSDIKLAEEMVRRGQIELFGGGETEPVLAVIPNRDRIAQLNSLSDKLEKQLGFRPIGAWLTERVWDATVVPALYDCGLKYVTVDDYHFLCSGKDEQDLNGFFSTEEDGKRLDLFPISEALRYRIPFSPAAAAVQYIESLATEEKQHATVYFDDIEKFGIWPETFDWVYEKGWLEDFIQKVLASPVIEIAHFHDYHRRAKTRGIVYLPTTSYIEMNEWTLPPQRAVGYAKLVANAKHSGSYENDKSFLRGGIWKNFFSRYPESNWMHKRMLQLSSRYHQLPKKLQTAEMLETLFETQANDAYWHGLFGGLYLPHLRRAVFRALVSLEAMLDRVAPRAAFAIQDINLDGDEELVLQNGKLQAIIGLGGSASIRELDAYFLNHNFADTLMRRVEHYHQNITAENLGTVPPDGSGILSPHDRVKFKDVITAADLEVDHHLKTSFYDQMTSASGTKPFAYVLQESRNFPIQFEGSASESVIRKQFTLSRNVLTVDYLCLATDANPADYFATEINLAMPSCDGPGGRFVVGGEVAGGFGSRMTLSDCSELILRDDNLGGYVRLTCDPPLKICTRPHHTVSQSEAGFEKIMQALRIELQWPLSTAFKQVIISMEILKDGN